MTNRPTRRVSPRSPVVPLMLTMALAMAVAAALVASPQAQASDALRPTHRDVVYATVEGAPLALDVYLPAGVTRPPLLVWVHGGAWRQGSKASPPLGFVRQGVALASLDFRLSTQARFPAMVHDIKGAIRFLRARAGQFGYRSDRIAIGGDSSGAHLATLVGVTADVRELEGSVGEASAQSSAVQAIVDYYGATNLTTILAQSTPFGLGVRQPALDLLLGGPPDVTKPLATLASPVFHVDRNDPPLLIFHGDQDPQMPINQSHELQGAYEKVGLRADFVVVHGSAHGGEAFYSGANLDRAVAFVKAAIGR